MSGALRAAALLAMATVAASGYAGSRDAMIAPGPERPWTVPDTAGYSAIGRDRADAPAIEPGKAYELAELIDIAQRTNPETRMAWERAREAALAVGLAESVYAPVLAAKATVGFQHVSSPLPTAIKPEGFFAADTEFFLPSLTLKWLLFDFGGREATLDATRQGLAAANFGFNATHQRIVFDVTRAYYAVNTVQGRVEVARASLALAQLEAMGVRPTTAVSVASLAGRALPAAVEDTADKLVDRALAQRPDLMARVATLRAREADIAKAESEFYPRIVVAGDLGQNIGRVRTEGTPGWSSVNQPAYGAAISIEVPIFDGGLRRDRLGVARSQRRIAEEELERARDQAVRQVVKAYEDLKVSLRRREAAVALLTAAEKSHDAAIDSYRSGVATFVDVTNAQTALTKARTADIETRSAAFTAAASLAFSTGDLAAHQP